MAEANGSALKKTNLTLLEGVGLIVGANIGSGILSLAYGAKSAGWPILVFWVIVAGILTTVSMLYVAETTLRTKKWLQLSGLAEKYVGKLGSWLMFISVVANSLGAMIAYTTGSGDILADFLNIPHAMGSLLFTIPAVGVVWFGLKVSGVSEKIVVSGMILLIIILVFASIIGLGLEPENIFYTDFKFAIPVFSLAIFAFIAQYTVPALARGYATKENVKNLPKAIILGMLLTAVLLMLVPMAALGVLGPENVTEVITVAWADALGEWAFFVANGFALVAMMTSYWAIGESYLTNIVDMFKFPSEWSIKHRVIAIVCVAVPPFILAYSGLVGFVDAISIAGSFAGAVMAIVPVMMINKARKVNEQTPLWTCGRLAHPIIQTILIVVFVGAAVYTLLGLLNVLPKGW
ncbi:MAG TPA: aromatic amino acid transport family protein [Virgibacillus sp.]|nr:aromatic amino acid transport family protein [Virgibacillus sp.]